MSGHVLIIDDELDMGETVARALAGRGYEAVAVGRPELALERLEHEPSEVVLTDLALGDHDGLELCREILSRHVDIPIVVFTAFGSMETAIGAIRAGAYDFVTKPVDMETLGMVVDRAMRFSSLQREVKRLKSSSELPKPLGPMIGESRAMRHVADLVSRIAPTDASVLVTGESGTGKELVARAVHELSGRTGRFVPVNCAAVPENLLESELFGHVRGAFTDAKTGKKGLFLDADGGTVFLDEIGELPLAMQPKLLRALQERRVRPVGASMEVPFDARVIAATNRDLDRDVGEGRFREDLFYRVNVVTVELPPLRERGSDILALAQHFLERAAQRMRKNVTGIAPDAADKLVGYPFPGNVRELENAMERAVALARYDKIAIKDLPVRIRDHKSSAIVVTGSDETSLLTMQELEQRYMRKILEAAGGNKTRAAKILGFDRRTLYRKMERYGMQ